MFTGAQAKSSEIWWKEKRVITRPLRVSDGACLFHYSPKSRISEDIKTITSITFKCRVTANTRSRNLKKRQRQTGLLAPPSAHSQALGSLEEAVAQIKNKTCSMSRISFREKFKTVCI